MNIYFQQQTDAEDGFTKVDPSTLPDELKSLYKEMQADYTRKTQALAEERTKQDQERQRYEESLQQFGGLRNEVEQWRNWYASLESDMSGDQLQTNDHNEGDDVTDQSSKKVAALEQTISELKQQLDQVDTTVKATSDRTGRMFTYHTQLNDLQREHPELERDKLVQHAVDKGFSDLKAAYEDLYRDDIINAEVDKRVEAKLKEERAKGITGVGRQVVLKPNSEGPKSFGEATQSIIDQRAADGSLDLGG